MCAHGPSIYYITVCMYCVVHTTGLYILYNVLFSKFDLRPLLIHSTPAVTEMCITCTIQHANKVCAPSTCCMRLFLVPFTAGICPSCVHHPTHTPAAVHDACSLVRHANISGKGEGTFMSGRQCIYHTTADQRRRSGM